MSRASVVLALAVIGAIAAAAPSSAGSTTTCDASGLRAHHGTARNHVIRLTAKGTTCAVARRVALDVARKTAAAGPGDALPSRSLGYDVDLGDAPCAACTQQFRVTASRGSKRIRFRLDLDHE